MKKPKISEDPAVLALLDVLRSALVLGHKPREKVGLALQGLLKHTTALHQTEQFVKALVEQWCLDEHALREDLREFRSRRAFSLAFEQLQELSRSDATNNGRRQQAFHEAAERAYNSLLSSPVFSTMEPLAPLVKMAERDKKAGARFRGDDLRTILRNALAHDVMIHPILARADSAVRWFSGWTTWFPSLPPNLTLNPNGSDTERRAIHDPEHDEFVRTQVRLLAQESLKTWTFWPPSTSQVETTSKYAAIAVCLHMIAAPSAEALQKLDPESFKKLLACQSFAYRHGVAIAPNLNDYQEERWHQPGREVRYFMKRMEEEFKRVFGMSPEAVRREISSDLQLVLSRINESTDTFPSIWLSQGNRFQSHLCGLLASGSWGPARDLLRGTFRTGVYTRNVDGDEDPLSEETTLFYLQLFSVPAMYLAYRGGCYGVAAALGQILLAEHRAPHPGRGLGDRNVSIITRAAERIASTLRGSRDDAVETWTDNILAMIDRCMKKSIETRQPLWLDLL
jgi:hypothetical protein